MNSLGGVRNGILSEFEDTCMGFALLMLFLLLLLVIPVHCYTFFHLNHQLTKH